MTQTTTYTNEQLASMVSSGDSDALNQLYIKFTPLILSESKMYLGRMTTYDQDDLMQEGLITIWKAASTFKKGGFGAYLKAALKKHFINLYRDYTMKNLVCIAETEDYHGYGYTMQTLVVSDYAKAYREKHREECHRSYLKRKAEKEAERIALGLPKPEPKPRKPRVSKFTEEEKAERHRARALAYYHAHKEEQNAKKKAKRQAEKAAAMAAAMA